METVRVLRAVGQHLSIAGYPPQKMFFAELLRNGAGIIKKFGLLQTHQQQISLYDVHKHVLNLSFCTDAIKYIEDNLFHITHMEQTYGK